MNKRFLFALSLSSMLVLSACSFMNHGEIVGYEIVGANLHIGDIPNEALRFIYQTKYEDGYVKKSGKVAASYISDILFENGDSVMKKSKLTKSGDYTCQANVTFDGQLFIEEGIPFRVNSGFEDKYKLNAISIESNHSYAVGEVVSDTLSLEVTYTWDKHGDEIILYEGDEELSVSLFERGSTVDVINNPLEANKTYVLKASHESISGELEFTVNNGFIRYSKEDLTITQQSIDGSIPPAKGEMKTLIIPITLQGDATDEWTEENLSPIDGYFFDKSTTRVRTFRGFYEMTSFGQLSVTGMVAEPYVEEAEDMTTADIQGDDTYGRLFDLIENAVEGTMEKYPDVDWSEFDANNDGNFDSIHLCTNWNSAKAGGDVWNTPLWPHKWQTGNNSGTHERPSANVYSIDAIDHFKDSLTAIHEQGHIFGLDDYYDYEYSGADYIGYADMQSMNCFDWNSYSKLSVGWVSPYVINGQSNSVTLTMSAASLNGDCLIIPADYSTWNGSAFDEYFLIELFSPFNCNTYDWKSWSAQYNDLGDFGVRLYHVDSRLYDRRNRQETDDPSRGTLLTNNSRRENNSNPWDQYPLLRLIQATGKDTFSRTGNGSATSHYLAAKDLFHEGDTFTFNKYCHMLSKYGRTISAMDNGETFPWTIHFDSMSKEKVTITISRQYLNLLKLVSILQNIRQFMSQKMKQMDGVKVVRRWGPSVFLMAFFMLVLAANVTFFFFFPLFTIDAEGTPISPTPLNLYNMLVFFNDDIMSLNPVYAWIKANCTTMTGNVVLVSQWSLFALCVIMYVIGLLSAILVIKAFILMFAGKSHHIKATRKTSVTLFILYLLLNGGAYGYVFYLQFIINLNGGIPGCTISYSLYNLIQVGVSLLLMIIIIIIYTASFRHAIFNDEARRLSNQIDLSSEALGGNQGEGQAMMNNNNGSNMNQPTQKIIITKYRDNIPQNVRHIGGHEYSNNQYLKIANIPEGVPSIGIGAFANCLHLQAVSIPKSVKKIKANAFFNCVSLERITYDGTKEEWAKVARGSNWLSKAGTSVVVTVNGSIIVNPLKQLTT